MQIFDIDIYKLYNIKPDASQKIIRKEYKKLVLQYHPDKPTGNSEIFELVNNAYTILIDDELRSKYDVLFKMKNEYDTKEHNEIKSNYINYKKTDLSVPNESVDKENILEFDKKWKELDKKHCFYEQDQNTDKMFVNIKKQRSEKEEIDNVFKSMDINNKKFNIAFDNIRTKHISNEIIPIENIQCANDSIVSQYTGIFNFEPYEDGPSPYSNKYSNINSGSFVLNKDQKEEVCKMDLSEDKYVIDHKMSINDMKKKMNQYETNTEKYNSMSMSEFND